MATPRSGSLFSGVAGLDQAVAQVFGTEPAWFCDNDPAACCVLALHYPGVSILGDITAVDWADVEPVDLLTAGWPCQPWSAAGKRKGTEDVRALWPEVDRALRALRPRIVALENVPRIVTAGELDRVADTLASLGYRFGWVVLGADEVGAPHRRNRCFILGMLPSVARGVGSNPAGNGREQGWPEPAGLVGRSDAALGGGEAPSDTAGPRRWQPRRIASGAPQGTESEANTDAGRGGGTPAADAGRSGQRPSQSDVRPGQSDAAGGGVDWGVYGPAVRRWERVIGRAAPVPRVAGPRGGLKLNPALPEWMQGFSLGWITDVPGVSMNDALRLAGNSVNPLQAAAALRWLLTQLDSERAA